jgi:1,4-dihydroxy-6-naphthoate synthase
MKVGFSPCPNDTFIFYAWVHGIVGEPITPHLHDIQALNETTYPLSKYSVVTAFHKGGSILPVGAALGFGVGPLVIGKHPLKKVAIPGKGTVAHLLFDLFLEEEIEKVFTTYDQIMPMIEKGEVDGGVIIHESRFIYQNYGFKLLYDLGDLWERKTALPLPLGALVLQEGYEPRPLIETLRSSIDYAKNHFDEAFSYIQHLSQEKERSIIQQHISLYVNEETYCLSDLGKRAISKLFELAQSRGLLHESAALCFCNPS